MSEKADFRAGRIVKGKVDPFEIQSRYVIIWDMGLGRISKVAKAINIMAKAGWTVCHFTGDYACLMERD